MKKLFLLLVPCMAFAATEPINVNTADGHVKETSSGVGDPTKPFDFSDVTVTGLPGGGGGVSTFSAGNLSPLFTTSVANPTTAPALSFTLSTAAANSWFGNATGSTAAPAFNTSVFPAALMPAFTGGDVTSSAGSLVLTIGSKTVSFAKMQDITTDRLIGRDTTGTGSPEEIGVDGGIEFQGTGSIAIADNGVTDGKLRDSSALSVIGRSANSIGDPADISTTAASGAVLRENGSAIGFGTVATAGIANDAVTLAKIQNAAANSKLLGSGDAGSGADYVEITLGSGLSMTGTTLSVTAGGGNVSNTGTPTDGQLSQWATSTTIRGVTPTSPIVSTGGGTPSITLNVGVDHAFTALQTVTINNATVDAFDDILQLNHTSTGTVLADFGASLSMNLEDASGALGLGSAQITAWSDPANATRTSYMAWRLKNSGATGEKMRLFGSGGLSVNSTTDPGAGQINANTGFKIANAALNFSHLAGDFALTQTPSAAADKLIGRGNGGGAGDWQEITLGTNLSMSGTTLNATGGGATTFLGLTDTPSSYTGEAAKLVRVNAGETGLEFVTASGGGNVSNVGTPVDNQIAIWTTATTIEGDADFTFDGTVQTITSAPAANTYADALVLQDTTDASDGNQQYSGGLRFTGEGWKTDATAESRVVDNRMYLKPVQGAANPTAELTIDSRINAGAWTNTLKLDEAGRLTVSSYNLSNLSNWSIYSNGTGAIFYQGGTNQFYHINDALRAINAGDYQWSSSADATGSADTGLSRNAAGVVEVNNGTAGQYRDVIARSIELNSASDTSLTRSAAGVLAVEGVDVLTTATGAPVGADYLVGTANGSLSAEIVVGTSPGGELGGSWASPTIDDSVAVSSWNLTTPTITGAAPLAESASIQLDNTIADTTWTGITIPGTSGFAQTYGDLVYLDDTTSRWEECDANAAAAADGDSRRMLGIVVVTGTDGNACTILLQGTVRAATQFPTFTAGAPLYVSETAGEVTQTQPTTADVVIRVVGYGLDQADTMYFNPSGTWTTHL